MRILVTGCYGNIGRIAVDAYLKQGWQVTGLDVIDRPENAVEGGANVVYIKGSTTDYETVKQAMTGCDTVLHLAGYIMPYSAPEQEMFAVNAGGTFNVFKAAAELGIRFLTVASSVNTIGYNFGNRIPDIETIPITGDHPKYTTDPYSYTKECVESIGEYFHRRYGINSVFMHYGLDFYYTVEEWMEQPGYAQRVRSLRKRLDAILALPEEEQAEKIREIEDGLAQKRQKAFDCPKKFANGTEYNYEYYDEEQEIWNYYVHNFFLFLDKRDMAEALVCSVKAAPEGVHIVTICDHQNMIGIETEKLAKLCYPKAEIDEAYAKNTTNSIADYRDAQKGDRICGKAFI